ncbi:MAG: Ig-like domain-containing protein, partial [Methanomassiliicoccaceae archaeon]|jgi:cobalamin biosynthesis Mg chelatase CobN|nr:Ig-like domain-containing protein [Methanomassiliicoccaceae archaeon]
VQVIANFSTYLTNVKAIVSVYVHSVVLLNDGTVWACGYNSSGQPGDGTTADKSYPVNANFLNFYNIDVTSITVSGAGGAATITTDKGTLQMSAVVSPIDATNKNVTWSVVNGTGSATISSSGLLAATTNGTVTVRATAVDGSDVYGELTVTISGQTTPVPSSGNGDGGGFPIMIVAIAIVAIVAIVGAVWFFFLKK